MRIISFCILFLVYVASSSQCPVEDAEHRYNYKTTTEYFEDEISKYVFSKRFKIDEVCEAQVLLCYHRFKDQFGTRQRESAGMYKANITFYYKGIPDIENCKVTYEDLTTEIISPSTRNIDDGQNFAQATFSFRGDIFNYEEQWDGNGKTQKADKWDFLLKDTIDITKNITSLVFLTSNGTKKVLVKEQAQLNIACLLHRFKTPKTEDIVE